jgi:hypothetical protein
VAEGRLRPRTINKYLLALHAIFKRAQRHWGLVVNPVAGVDRQPVRRSAEFCVLSSVHHAPQHDAADRLSRRLARASTAAAVLDAAESSPAP